MYGVWCVRSLGGYGYVWCVGEVWVMWVCVECKGRFETVVGPVSLPKSLSLPVVVTRTSGPVWGLPLPLSDLLFLPRNPSPLFWYRLSSRTGACARPRVGTDNPVLRLVPFPLFDKCGTDAPRSPPRVLVVVLYTLPVSPSSSFRSPPRLSPTRPSPLWILFVGGLPRPEDRDRAWLLGTFLQGLPEPTGWSVPCPDDGRVYHRDLVKNGEGVPVKMTLLQDD